MLFITGTYGISLLKGWIRGSIFFHRNLGMTTATIALIHAILALSIFLWSGCLAMPLAVLFSVSHYQGAGHT